MIIEPTHNVDSQWQVTHESAFWGCICNSTTKEGATKVVAMDYPERPKVGVEVVSMFYGFISDHSREELIQEAESRGLEIDLPEEIEE